MSKIISCFVMILASIGIFINLVLLPANAGQVSYSSEQADRGKKKYEIKCAECHGKDFNGGMNGGPPLRGVAFLENWGNGEPASSLYYFLSEEMPPESPGRFSLKVYTDLMSYILKRNGFKRGAPLPTNVDALDELVMKKR